MKLSFHTFLQKYKNLSANTQGFTLIELLVVIGILGILASALVATIDPFEQLKKGNDSAVQNVAVEFVNANVRYYTTQNRMPWGTNGGTTCVTGTSALTAYTLNNLTTCMSSLITQGELKSAFTTATGILSKVLISGAGDSTSSSDAGVTACFLPESKSMQANKNTQFASSGTVLGSSCKANGGTVNCYWCAL